MGASTKGAVALGSKVGTDEDSKDGGPLSSREGSAEEMGVVGEELLRLTLGLDDESEEGMALNSVEGPVEGIKLVSSVG